MGFTRSFRVLKNNGILQQTNLNEKYLPKMYKGDAVRYAAPYLDGSMSYYGFRTLSRYTYHRFPARGYCQQMYITFGQGTTPELVEDYTLDQPFTENNSSLVPVYLEQELTYDAEKLTHTCTVREAVSVPEGGTAVTIKEYGIAVNVTSNTNTEYQDRYTAAFRDVFNDTNTENKAFVMIYREVLPEDQWVTINPGETREFSFTIPDIEAGYTQ